MNRIDLSNVVYFSKPKPLNYEKITGEEKLYKYFTYLNNILSPEDDEEIREWLMDNKRNNFQRVYGFLNLYAIEKLGDKFENKFLKLDEFERKDFLFLLCRKYNLGY